jgi:hypothetical protein
LFALGREGFTKMAKVASTLADALSVKTFKKRSIDDI